MEKFKALIMCRTGMGSSLMIKIKVDKLIRDNKYPIDVSHDAYSGFAGQTNVDLIITMDDLVEEFSKTDAYVIGIKDIMDVNYMKEEIDKFLQTETV